MGLYFCAAPRTGTACHLAGVTRSSSWQYSCCPAIRSRSFLSADAAADQATIDAMKAQYGLRPALLVQYFKPAWQLLGGDVGYSLASDSRWRPASARWPDHPGAGLQCLRGGRRPGCGPRGRGLVEPLGRRCGAHHYLRPLFAAVPVFWLGLVLLQLLSIQLGVMSLFPDGSFASLAVPSLSWPFTFPPRSRRYCSRASLTSMSNRLSTYCGQGRVPRMDLLPPRPEECCGSGNDHCRHHGRNPACRFRHHGDRLRPLRPWLGGLQAVTVQDVPLVQGLVC